MVVDFHIGFPLVPRSNGLETILLPHMPIHSFTSSWELFLVTSYRFHLPMEYGLQNARRAEEPGCGRDEAKETR